MKCSERFLNFVQQQLKSFQGDHDIDHLVVYVARSNDGGAPTLEVIGEWPASGKVLPPVENDPELRAPSSTRRWYPLQEDSILLGVIRAEIIPSSNEWPEFLDQRLQATSIALANSLGLELEKNNLIEQLNEQKDQISLMVHQLRNPLAALGTYAKLLLRKLGPDNKHISLVEGLISEQAQLNKYLLALDEIGQVKLPSGFDGTNSLLLPPVLPTDKEITLNSLIDPLIERAKATASLQGRTWVSPLNSPDWMNEPRANSDGVIAEIVANLIENAFKYSPKNVSLGLEIIDSGICVWDAGTPIAQEERDMIFQQGFRGESSLNSKGSGLGLALGRRLAKQVGGDLNLVNNPSEMNPSLPKKGNAFVLSFNTKKPIKLVN